MKEIIVIGTLHHEFTPKSELEELLKEINPDKVLVELSPEEMLRPREDSIRDEMFFAYDWAIENGKQVDVYDIENDILKEGVTGKEPDFAKVGSEIGELLKSHSWKEQNNEEVWKTPEYTKLEDYITEKYFNAEKIEERDQIMLQNIKDKLIEGKNLILTGTAHLTFFKEQLPDTILPLTRHFMPSDQIGKNTAGL